MLPSSAECAGEEDACLDSEGEETETEGVTDDGEDTDGDADDEEEEEEEEAEEEEEEEESEEESEEEGSLPALAKEGCQDTDTIRSSFTDQICTDSQGQ